MRHVGLEEEDTGERQKWGRRYAVVTKKLIDKDLFHYF